MVEQNNIDLKEYLAIFKKRAWILILVSFISVTMSVIQNFFLIDPLYEAHLTFMVNFNQNENAQITQSDMDYGTKLVETYKPIVQSKKVTATIKKNLNLTMSQGEIGNAISINSISGPVMKVTVTNTNPELAAKIANEVPDVFGAELKRIAKVDGIEVIDQASIPTWPISPNKPRNIMMAFVIGIAISVFIILLLDYLDNKVKSVEDVEKYLELPVLGIVSEFESRDNKKKKKRKKTAKKAKKR